MAESTAEHSTLLQMKKPGTEKHSKAQGRFFFEALLRALPEGFQTAAGSSLHSTQLRAFCPLPLQRPAPVRAFPAPQLCLLEAAQILAPSLCCRRDHQPRAYGNILLQQIISCSSRSIQQLSPLSVQGLGSGVQGEGAVARAHTPRVKGIRRLLPPSKPPERSCQQHLRNP